MLQDTSVFLLGGVKTFRGILPKPCYAPFRLIPDFLKQGRTWRIRDLSFGRIPRLTRTQKGKKIKEAL